MKLFKRQDITGSDNSTYMVRWILIGCRFFSIRVHKFVRDDHDVPHDHPWDFFTIILKGGYWETEYHGEPFGPLKQFQIQSTTWFKPGSFRIVKAETRHRVRLKPLQCRCVRPGCNGSCECKQGHSPCTCRTTCWTLVFTGPNRRKWGFWCPRGWVEWREFLFNRKGICDDH